MRIYSCTLLVSLTITGIASNLQSANAYSANVYRSDSERQQILTNELQAKVDCSNSEGSPPPGCPRRDT
jgi:hypothetical protein